MVEAAAEPGPLRFTRLEEDDVHILDFWKGVSHCRRARSENHTHSFNAVFAVRLDLVWTEICLVSGLVYDVSDDTRPRADASSGCTEPSDYLGLLKSIALLTTILCLIMVDEEVSVSPTQFKSWFNSSSLGVNA